MRDFGDTSFSTTLGSRLKMYRVAGFLLCVSWCLWRVYAHIPMWIFPVSPGWLLCASTRTSGRVWRVSDCAGWRRGASWRTSENVYCWTRRENSTHTITENINKTYILIKLDSTYSMINQTRCRKRLPLIKCTHFKFMSSTTNHNGVIHAWLFPNKMLL